MLDGSKAASKGRDRRRSPRFNISLPVTFTDSQSGCIYAATVDNISLGGVLLLTDQALEQGTRVTIHLPIGRDHTANIGASIVRTSSVGEVGVAFVELPEDELERLSAFVEERSSTA